MEGDEDVYFGVGVFFIQGERVFFRSKPKIQIPPDFGAAGALARGVCSATLITKFHFLRGQGEGAGGRRKQAGLFVPFTFPAHQACKSLTHPFTLKPMSVFRAGPPKRSLLGGKKTPTSAGSKNTHVCARGFAGAMHCVFLNVSPTDHILHD